MTANRMAVVLDDFVRDGVMRLPLGVFAVADRKQREVWLFAAPVGCEDSAALILNTKSAAFTEFLGDGETPACGAYWEDTYHSEATLPVCTPVFSTSTGLRGFANEAGAPSTTRGQIIGLRQASEEETHAQLWVSVAAAFEEPPQGAWSFANQESLTPPGTPAPIAISTVANRTARVWPPRAVARAPKLVTWLVGAYLTLREVRMTFRSSGRRVPIGEEN